MLEEGILCLLILLRVIFGIVDQHETDEVSCQPILKEFLMMAVLWSGIAEGDHYEPEAITEACFKVDLV